ncbi:hypothetical protein QR680_008283 [Steinernema hermaphroditum]|uniref:C-type lectin domain-containing protein n=1 Tax=Steinernema hermaphroditum TaxID=289476 RepID=A0AA39M7U2_9BILA|nr:hypothetical protein QR680_008283 [Steinernema hermaphroditum]
MPTTKWFFFLIPLLEIHFVTSTDVDVKYRFTYISSRIVGSKTEHSVGSLDDCGDRAYDERAFAFAYVANSTGHFCTVVHSFDSLEENSRPQERHFLMDKRDIKGLECREYRETVREIIDESEDCDDDEAICEALQGVASSFPFHPPISMQIQETQCALKSDHPDCVCPTGWTEVCCPERTQPRTDKDGTQFCCPPTGPCCPFGMSIVPKQKGNICCPTGFKYSPEFGSCLQNVEIMERPQTITALNQHCWDLDAEPVKIENREQNQKIPQAIIGLQIPEDIAWGVDNFRWASDNSVPTFTHWKDGEPNNHNNETLGDEVEKTGREAI